jgi:hypothetical protein
LVGVASAQAARVKLIASNTTKTEPNWGYLKVGKFDLLLIRIFLNPSGPCHATGQSYPAGKHLTLD